MSDPFLLSQPSIISFSGGRTSALMLRRILDAHGGKLPPDLRPIFCNTGKERPETLDFVEMVSQRWAVPITWLEYRWEPGRHYFVEVTHATASRNGEPFRLAIAARSYLPNPVARFCTVELKIRTTWRYVRSVLGWKNYGNAIGLRADEPKTVAKMRRQRTSTVEIGLFDTVTSHVRGAEHPPGEQPVQPLFDAGVTLHDVDGYWREQRGGMDLRDWLGLARAGRPGWDLELRSDEGNCDLCFMKGAGRITRIMEEHPDLAAWWIESEALKQSTARKDGAVFRHDRPSYEHLFKMATGQTEDNLWLRADDDDGSCGELNECRCTD